MRLVQWVTMLVLSAVFGCGEEPERIVSGTTDDGRFELTLEARKNSLKPGETLLVQVTVESLQGRLATSHADTINFFANAGTVQSNRLIFTFVGLDDTLYTGEGPTTSYTDWVTYTMSTSSTLASSDRQGEVIAQFRDLQAVLKIRIVRD